MSSSPSHSPSPKKESGGGRKKPPKEPYSNVFEASHIYFLPNSFTAGNLFFGFLAIIWCIRGRYEAITDAAMVQYYTTAVFFILGAGVCDMFDGRVARLGGRESLFGKEFDSIADVVSFGVAPALMVFFLILSPTTGYEFYREIGWLIGFIYLLCAAVRLARFNVLTNPNIPGSDHATKPTEFLGLPAPAAAGLVASIVLVVVNFDLREFSLFLPPLLLLSALLMVSNVPYPSFKYIDWQTRLNVQNFILLIAVIAAVLLFWQWALAACFIVYIFYGLIRHVRVRRRPVVSAE